MREGPWIDFGSAQTFSEGRLRLDRGWFEEEDEIMDYLVDGLVSSGLCLLGLADRTDRRGISKEVESHGFVLL